MRAYELTDTREPISLAEIDYLAELARQLPPNSLIVNIGAYIGVSTCTFLEARPDCTIYSVDLEPCEAEFENVRRFGFDSTRIIRLLDDSKAIGQNFPYKADLVFVDGDHWNAKGDIDAWRDKIKPGGMMAFHDYLEINPPENPGDVYAQVNNGMADCEQIGQVERVIAFRL